jgi:HD-like signal output (HDOD) protein
MPNEATTIKEQTQPQQSDRAAAFPWATFRFPPFPESAVRALNMVNDENTSMRHLSDLISSDPALSCEVLIIANSVLLAQRHPVTSVLQATVLLGTRTLKGVCLTIAVRAYLGQSMRYPALRAIWRHSLATALIAEQLTSTTSVEQGTAYTAGIVHDIGRFALAALRPREYAQLLEQHSGCADSVLEQERTLFGFDHREAGLQLMKQWGLPDEFEPMLHGPSGVKTLHDAWQLGDLIGMSCQLADTAGFAVSPKDEVTPYEELMAAMPVRVRSLFHADVKRLTFDIHTRMASIEGL